MKRQHAEIGIKYWGNQDLLDLQTEPFKALDGFFAQYGPCIINGCEVTAHQGTFAITPGLVVLEGVNHHDKAVTMIVPFAGTTATALPIYLTLAYAAQVREYGDGKVKPIAYEYAAQASTLPPAAEVKHLILTADHMPRFVDVLGDQKHSFITDIERAVWNAKETTVGSQAKADAALSAAKTHASTGDAATLASAKSDASTKTEAALRSAKEYTNTREGIIRTDCVAADAIALASAKSYADQIVAALVSTAPEALNTLKELAAALGNDPNFATTVMNEIGKRVTTEAFNAAIGGKLDKKGGVANGNFKVSMENVTDNSDYILFGKDHIGTAINNSKNGVTTSQLRLNHDGRITHYNGFTDKKGDIWTSETFNPNSKMNATTKTEGDCNDWSQNGVYVVGMDAYAVKILNRPFDKAFSILTMQNAECTQIATNYADCTMRIRTKHWSMGWGAWNTFWSSVNFNPASKAEANHTHTAATTSANGLMSTADKSKLDGIAASANNYTHPNDANTRHVTDAEKAKINAIVGNVHCFGTIYSTGGKGFIKGTMPAIGHPETGVYRITHGIGSIDYIFTATVQSTATRTICIATKAANFLDVVIRDNQNNTHDHQFDFVLTKV